LNLLTIETTITGTVTGWEGGVTKRVTCNRSLAISRGLVTKAETPPAKAALRERGENGYGERRGLAKCRFLTKRETFEVMACVDQFLTKPMLCSSPDEGFDEKQRREEMGRNRN
jgi:hypothetical protein